MKGVHLAVAREGDQIFSTGRPIDVTFLRNTDRAPPLRRGVADTYQQKIEPAGLYVILDPDPHRAPLRPWVRGRVRLHSPLVVRWSETGSYDETSWKVALAKACRARGRTLTRCLLQKGYDAVVTVGDHGTTREIVLLEPQRAIFEVARDRRRSRR